VLVLDADTLDYVNRAEDLQAVKRMVLEALPPS